MPHYYPDDQSKENLNKIRRESVCAECGRQLAIYFTDDKRRFLACSGRVHEGITREYKPPVEDYESNIRREMKLEETHGRGAGVVLAKYQSVSVMTRDIATEIVDTLWGDAPPIEKSKAIILCHTYNLNPLMKHLHLVPYKKWNQEHTKVIGQDWAMMLGIQAKRLMAHRKHNFGYLDMTPRIMTEEEQVKVFGKVQAGHIMSITIIKDTDTGAVAQGYGKIKTGEKVKGEDKGNSPEHMSQIRSESQAVERLYPGEMPENMEVIDEAYVDAEVVDVKGVGKVEKETGEVVESTTVDLPDIGKVDLNPGEIKEEPVEAEFKEVPETEPEATEAKKLEEQPLIASLIDLAWLKESIRELQKKGISAYSDESLIGYMRSAYKGIEGETIYEIAEKLDKGMAKHFHNVIQDALDKA
ncbi:hypothetical protein LCGC14_0981160 [marine sediment metagenome]|uniref:Uncharacterized protein n=1 Tax=marine sediment metagenome TaxID=412755 RepID=A0A0F9ND54_9ZZZZ